MQNTYRNGQPSERSSAVRVIDVAICTYRRASLDATLRSIASQILPLGTSLRIIVADNDDTPSARALVMSVGTTLGLDYRYIHAPKRNISVARNACLDAGDAPLLAFIDDDESAMPGWLAALAARLDETGADAVLGPARARYPLGAPAWASRADLHSTKPPVTETGAIRTGYTCNVLLRRSAFGERRFDVDLGRSGGEDDVFFAGAVHDGARIAYAADAVVDDPVPISRLTLRWLCRRSFRNGQTYARTRLTEGASRPVLLAKAAGKAFLCLVAATVTLPDAVRWRRTTVRGMLHIGACATYLGRPDLLLY